MDCFFIHILYQIVWNRKYTKPMPDACNIEWKALFLVLLFKLTYATVALNCQVVYRWLLVVVEMKYFLQTKYPEIFSGYVHFAIHCIRFMRTVVVVLRCLPLVELLSLKVVLVFNSRSSTVCLLGFQHAITRSKAKLIILNDTIKVRMHGHRVINDTSRCVFTAR